MIGVYKISSDDAYVLYIVLLGNDSSSLNSLLKIQLGAWQLAPSLEDRRAVFVVVGFFSKPSQRRQMLWGCVLQPHSPRK